jgi:HEAT repeat protein
MRPTPAGNDFDAWVRLLGVAQSRQGAKRHLLAAGAPAVPALRRGLQHRDATVRRVCAAILDHLLDEDAVPDLVAALDDDDPAVCARALHALACDACKENECRPTDDLFLPRALELLRHPDPDVRAAAIDAVGRVAERRPEVAVTLVAVVDHERDAGLRNMARRRAQRARPRRDLHANA